ncbi:hypothetical protein ABT116_36255 [Streptomyces sp. NPDC002130]
MLRTSLFDRWVADFLATEAVPPVLAGHRQQRTFNSPVSLASTSARL